jgi:endonuclease/exonuclease/phosphatase family metal-dependent hydrolase
VLTVLVVCLTTATVVTLGVRHQQQAAATPASLGQRLGLASGKPLLPPVSQRHLRGQSAAHGDPAVSRSLAGPRGEGSRAGAKADPAPAKVVGGGLIVHKTKAQIDQALRAAAERAAARRPFSFTIGSFNVLGSQHSTRTGDHPGFPSAGWRSPAAVGVMRAHGVDILGLQETQPDQLNTLQRLTGFAAYPGYAFGSNETDNSILYDTSKFDFVSGSSFTIHFMHADRPQTILRLRDKATGREFYVLNMHASAGFGGPYAATRRAGHLIAAATVNRLKADGIPIFLTGDMNDRAEFFCRVVPLTGMVSFMGGSVSGGCHPPPRMDVDWVLGWGGVTFSNYWQDRSTVARKVSDHFFVSATATIAPQ